MQLLSKIYKTHAATALLGLVFSAALQAQGFSLGGGVGGLPQGLSAQDLNFLRGGGSSGFGGGALGALGGAGIGNLTGPGLIALPMLPGNEDDTDSPGTDKKGSAQKAGPLAPNEFQKFVLEVSGKAYPLYGSDFFENLRNHPTSAARAPVADDYVLGAGDQLLIRLWGSTSGETQVSLDRNGEISIPKLGTLKLAGVKASQAEGVVKSLFARHYKDFEISVTLGKLRKITVYVVGQSRFPGSYSLASQSTLTSGLFASGGPNGNGSIRRVQLKRQGAVVSEFDLYNFLSKGDKTADVKLHDGDVIYFPRAAGYMAFIGKVNTPGVYEIKDATETVGDFLSLAGGLPVVADPRRATLERLSPGTDQPRRIEAFALDALGLQKTIKSGDLVSVAAIIPELANGITLRGNVAQPARLAWRAGMRVSDVISRKSLLISPDSTRRQNEVLFDAFEQERSARYRARIPLDLAIERMAEKMPQDAELDGKAKSGVTINMGQLPPSGFSSLGTIPGINQDSDRLAAKPSFVPEDSLLERIGSLIEEVNLDYAVIERIHREDLRVSVIPFNLGRVLANATDPDNLPLEPGDVITVFSAKDLRVPLAKRRIFVLIEGEVQMPGVYPVLPGDSLTSLIQKAGGITPDAYLYGLGFYREEVRKSQQQNLQKLLNRMEAEGASALSQASQSTGATSDAGLLQAKILAMQQTQRQAVERVRSLKPEGRIALGVPAELQNRLDQLPRLRLSQGDRLYLPARPDFIYIFGSVNTESALIFKAGLTVADYLRSAGLGSGADPDNVILLRADGSALTNQRRWGNELLSTQAMPGDTIVIPEKLDRESAWSSAIRSVKDFTQILYQLGLGVAAIKVLRQ